MTFVLLICSLYSTSVCLLVCRSRSLPFLPPSLTPPFLLPSLPPSPLSVRPSLRPSLLSFVTSFPIPLSPLSFVPPHHFPLPLSFLSSPPSILSSLPPFLFFLPPFLPFLPPSFSLSSTAFTFLDSSRLPVPFYVPFSFSFAGPICTCALEKGIVP